MTETRWTRTRAIGSFPVVRTSKFLTGEASISPEQLRAEFQNWSRTEQLDFVNAYVAKPDVTGSDEEIIRFLVESGDAVIQEAVAIFSTRHSDKEYVFQFLLRGLRSPGRKANFIFALGRLNDVRAVAPLRELWNVLESQTREATAENELGIITDFLYCCRNLAKLTGNERYLDQFPAFLDHPNASVRRIAEFINKRKVREEPI